MPQVNFYLKKANAAGMSLIYLKFRYSRQKLVLSFGQSIDPKNWNAKKQRIKSNGYITNDGSHYLNDLLNNLENICISTYNKEIQNGIPTTAVIKKALQKFLTQNTDEEEKHSSIPTLFELIDRFISGEIKFRGRDKSKGTLKAYKTSKASLLDFERREKFPVNYETVNLEMFYRYVGYMTKKGLAHNSIAKRIRSLKVYMAEAVDLGYTSNLQFKNKKFFVPEREVDAVYLTKEEILKLYRHDFSLNPRLDKVRDLFVFGCFTGLRYGDYSSIKPENIISHNGDIFLQIRTMKTNTLVVIPCNPVVLEIFDKYQGNDNRLPNAITGQKFNEYIKEACFQAGLTQAGRLLSQPTKKLFECISSHTARRSAVSNYFLEGVNVLDLMQITGHRSQAAFMRYIRVTKLQTAERLQQHIKDNWSKQLLKAI